MDLFGFSALPGGAHYPSGKFGGIGTDGAWWSSTELGFARYRKMINYLDLVADEHLHKSFGLSVRCVLGTDTAVTGARPRISRT